MDASNLSVFEDLAAFDLSTRTSWTDALIIYKDINIFTYKYTKETICLCII